MLVFRERAIDVIRGDAINGFTISPLVQGIGTRALHSIALIPQMGVMFLSPDGVFLINGGFDGGSQISVDKMSDAIVDTMKRLNKSNIARACGAYSEKWREYHVYFTADGGAPNQIYPARYTLGLVFHVEKMSWSIREGFPVNCLTVDSRGEFIFGHNFGQSIPTLPTNSGLIPDETGLFFISKERTYGYGWVASGGGPQQPVTYTLYRKGPLPSLWISANQDFAVTQMKKHVKYVYLSCFTEGANKYQVFYNKDWSYDYTFSNEGYGQRPEYKEQYVYDAVENNLVYGPTANPDLIVPNWELPLFTQLKFAIANQAASTFSVGIETENDFILVDYSLEFNTSGTETRAARSRSAY